jgi:hypothetical protein
VSNPTSATDLQGLRDTASFIGRFAWIESRLFEILGGWVQSTPEPAVKLVLARHSAHHAWHATLLREFMPVLHDFDTTTVDGPGDSTVAGLLDEVGAPGETESIERLTGVYGFALPAMLGAYDQWLTAANPFSDGPLLRALGFVVADERTDLLEGGNLLESLLVDEKAQTRAHRRYEQAAMRAEAANLLK